MLTIIGVEGEIFNLGSSKSISVTELAQAELELNRRRCKYGANLSERLGDIAQSYADISKAKRLLGSGKGGD